MRDGVFFGADPHPDPLPEREQNPVSSPSPSQGEGRGEGSCVHPRNLRLKERARILRHEMTEMEKTLWYYLRDRRLDGFKFRRQYPLGRYIADFIALEQKLIVELDGGQHASDAQYDVVRDRWLRQQGYSVLRFWNHEVAGNVVEVLEHIQRHLKNPHPCPLPVRERGKEVV